MRLTQFSTTKFSISRRLAKEELANGKFILNGKIIKKDIDVTENDILEYLTPKSDISFDINEYLVQQHVDVAFLYKPPFMHSDRQRPDEQLTMSDIITNLDGFKSLSRLDFEADGLVGCVQSTYKILHVKKVYNAIVYGKFHNEVNVSWSIDAENRKAVKVNDDYTGSLTNMKLIDYNGEVSMIEVTLDVAARHQVRAFCSKMEHAIVGDKLYGGVDFERLCLHCAKYEINEFSAFSKKHTDAFFDIYNNWSK